MIQFKYHDGGRVKAAGVRRVEVEDEPVENVKIFYPLAILLFWA